MLLLAFSSSLTLEHPVAFSHIIPLPQQLTLILSPPTARPFLPGVHIKLLFTLIPFIFLFTFFLLLLLYLSKDMISWLLITSSLILDSQWTFTTPLAAIFLFLLFNPYQICIKSFSKRYV